MSPAAPRARHAAAWAAVVGVLAGCGGIARVDVSFVDGQRDAAGRVLRSAVPTEDAELSLVRAALGVVPASGRQRPSVEGRAHFSRPAAAFYGLTLVRTDGLGAETWRLDAAWAVRELPDGIALCWEGDLQPVVEALRVVLPPSRRRP